MKIERKGRVITCNSEGTTPILAPWLGYWQKNTMYQMQFKTCMATCRTASPTHRYHIPQLEPYWVSVNYSTILWNQLFLGDRVNVWLEDSVAHWLTSAQKLFPWSDTLLCRITSCEISHSMGPPTMYCQKHFSQRRWVKCVKNSALSLQFFLSLKLTHN